MLVFGYGSLMWDGWEKQLDGKKIDKAILINYRRDFNKKSIKNWGTPKCPGPTLGLEYIEGAECIGSAFEFMPDKSKKVLNYLTRREGQGFMLKEVEIVLQDGNIAMAVTALNKRNHHSYIGDIELNKRADLARTAIGTSGSCTQYITSIRNKLNQLGVVDKSVDEFWRAIQ